MKAHENPFRTKRTEALAFRAEGFSWEALENRLEELGGRAAVVGPQGHGKTTLIEQWMTRRRAMGDAVVWLRASESSFGDVELSAVSGAVWVFLDSAECCDREMWSRFLHAVQPETRVVTTQHRRGRLPTIVVLRSSPDLLADLVWELTGEKHSCRRIWKRHRGDIRGALRELYDLASTDSLLADDFR